MKIRLEDKLALMSDHELRRFLEDSGNLSPEAVQAARLEARGRGMEIGQAPHAPGQRRIPLVAAVLSLLDPGLGFVYNGNLKKGILVSLLYIALAFAIYPLGLLKSIIGMVVMIALIIFPGFRFISLIKTVTDAKKVGRLVLRPFNRWYVYAIYPMASAVLVYLVTLISPTRSFSVPTEAMEPTIVEGENVVVDMDYYKDQAVKPGDVIVFRYPPNPQEFYMKRCIALGGQTVEIRDAIVYVDGQRFMPDLLLKRNRSDVERPGYQDPRIRPIGAGNEDQYGPVVVPQGSVFTLGDCRDNSYDSRYFGFVATGAIVGKALYVYWSKDLSRIGTTIR